MGAAAGFVGGDAVSVNKAQIREAKVCHGTCGSANIERVTWGDQDDA